jgi:hypothetical protein
VSPQWHYAPKAKDDVETGGLMASVKMACLEKRRLDCIRSGEDINGKDLYNCIGN